MKRFIGSILCAAMVVSVQAQSLTTETLVAEYDELTRRIEADTAQRLRLEGAIRALTIQAEQKTLSTDSSTTATTATKLNAR